MVGLVEKIDRKANSGDTLIEYTETFSAPGSTSPLRFQSTDSGVLVQLAGTATNIVAVIERSTKDPVRSTPNWAPAMTDQITGNLSLGIAPFLFDEPARGYWQLRIITLTGGNCTVVMTGEQA